MKIFATISARQDLSKGWGTIQIHREGCQHTNLGEWVGSGEDTPEDIAHIVGVQDGSVDDGVKSFDWRSKRMPCLKKEA